jgi:hypothetical protein
MIENSIMKPTKIVRKTGEERVKKSNRGLICSKYIICKYGNITMKPFVQLIHTNKNFKNVTIKEISNVSKIEQGKNKLLYFEPKPVLI